MISSINDPYSYSHTLTQLQLLSHEYSPYNVKIIIGRCISDVLNYNGINCQSDNDCPKSEICLTPFIDVYNRQLLLLFNRLMHHLLKYQ